jgi:hypothetical protein
MTPWCNNTPTFCSLEKTKGNMKKNLTEIIAILDRSGSMEHLVGDTIGGFNAFLKEQKKQPGDANLTVILFDDRYEVLHKKVVIADVPELTEKEYFARGSTALLDAVGKTISEFKPKTKKTKVICLIITDGYENASIEYKKTDIKKMVEGKMATGNWQFLFLGANIDSFAEAAAYGIAMATTSNYTANARGTASVYSSVTDAVSTYRKSGTVDKDWKKDVK